MDFDAYISELREAISAAALNHQIWWVYKSKETRPRFIDAMNRYPLFFQTSIHAHFVALLVALYRLYETRSDTVNIPTLLKQLRISKKLPDEVLDDLDEIYKEAKPLWLKVNLLRNNVFGHRTRAHTAEEIFKQAGISPNELRDLVKVTKKLLNRLTKAWDRSTHAFNLDATDDLTRLLSDLSKSR
jgi:hypothetical protein